jgi:Trypsin
MFGFGIKNICIGHTEYAGTSSNELMKVRLNILSNDECVEAFSDDDNIVVNGKTLCVSVLEGGKDTCQGGKA